MAVTLSCGDNGALGPPISVLTGVDQNTSDAAWRQIDRGASHHHIHRRLGAAIGNGAAGRIVGERTHATRDGDHQLSLTTGNVIAKGLEYPQGTHRIYVQHMGPRMVVDLAGLLPRRAGNPLLMSTSIVTFFSWVATLRTLSASVTSIATTLSTPPVSCAKHRSLLAASGLRHVANTRHPSATY
jgi:hypothetical protein